VATAATENMTLSTSLKGLKTMVSLALVLKGIPLDRPRRGLFRAAAVAKEGKRQRERDYPERDDQDADDRACRLQ
jgi:hypothetical protein